MNKRKGALTKTSAPPVPKKIKENIHPDTYSMVQIISDDRDQRTVHWIPDSEISDEDRLILEEAAGIGSESDPDYKALKLTWRLGGLEDPESERKEIDGEKGDSFGISNFPMIEFGKWAKYIQNHEEVDQDKVPVHKKISMWYTSYVF